MRVRAANLCALIAMFLLVGCARLIYIAGSPVLKIDDEHDLMSVTNAAAYRIPSSSRIVIDATSYTFKMRDQVVGKPVTEVCLIFGGATNIDFYLLDWEMGKTRYDLSGDTLRAADHSPRFSGFRSGEKWDLVISAAYETNASLIVWQGEIEVQ